MFSGRMLCDRLRRGSFARTYVERNGYQKLERRRGQNRCATCGDGQRRLESIDGCEVVRAGEIASQNCEVDIG